MKIIILAAISFLFCSGGGIYSQENPVSWLNDAIAEDPADFESVEKLVELYLKQRNYSYAESLLIEYGKIDSTNAKAVYLEGRVLDLSENINKAMEKYEKAIGLDSTLWEAYRDLAFLYDIFSDYDKMNRLIGSAIIFAPFPESLYYDYGYTYDMSGRIDSALYYYRKAAEFNQEDYQAFLNIGAIVGIKGDLDSAKYYTKKAISINQDTPEAFYNLGEINLSLGLFEKAISNFQHALALDSRLFAAQKKLGELYEIIGDSGMAFIYFKEFLNSAPKLYIKDIEEVRDKLANYK